MPQKLCPNDPENHKRFITVAHVSQDWVVDPQGNFLEVADASLETVAGPNYDNTWTCKECGAEAVRPIDLMSPEARLAKKFIDAGYAKCALREEDLKAIGIYKEPVTFKTKEGYRVKINSWEKLCQFVYETITDKPLPTCTLMGRGSRSQWHGEKVSEAIIEKYEIQESIK